jgi:integrase
MTGHIRRRGKASWEIKFDLGRDLLTGKRRIRYHSFKGSKREAEREAVRLIAAANTGGYIDPSRVAVGQFLDQWERDWAIGNVSPKTLERYTELLRLHVRPHIGTVLLQKINASALAELYGRLQRDGKLAPRTVGHVHRVLHRALGHAAQWGLIAQNVVDLVQPPRVEEEEISIVRADQVAELLRRLQGRSVYPLAAIALSTGMRRGELLALRWGDVDLDRAVIRVEQSIETTTAGLRFKPPKTRHGRRSITVPPTIVALLRSLWRKIHERRLALGLGKAPAEALVFANLDGNPLHPQGVTKQWKRAMTAISMTDVTLHSLRHTHASQLIAAGLDVLTISRRLGHGSPAITLRVYGHLFTNSDDKAASVVQAVFGATEQNDPEGSNSRSPPSSSSSAPTGSRASTGP